jgi:quinol monooxygenase YgiN
MLAQGARSILPRSTTGLDGGGSKMAVRIFVSMDTLPGKGAEFARLRAERHAEVRKEPGCEQYDMFQNTENPDQLLLVERWTDEACLAAHAELNRQRGPVGAELRAGTSRSERYIVD